MKKPSPDCSVLTLLDVDKHPYLFVFKRNPRTIDEAANPKCIWNVKTYDEADKEARRRIGK